MTQHIVIDLFAQAEELDVVGPWEVLSYWTLNHPEDGWRIDLISDDGRHRRCAKGLTLTPTATRGQVLDPAVVIEPGGRGSRHRMTDEHHLGWLRERATAGAVMASVCTGALVLAAAELLTDRPAATHHGAFDELAAVDPTITVVRDQRFVDDGAVITSAGVSAGIDMALHLVSRLSSPDRARQVQEGIEYYPEPPSWPAARKGLA